MHETVTERILAAQLDRHLSEEGIAESERDGPRRLHQFAELRRR
jgi:hypothetical protein